MNQHILDALAFYADPKSYCTGHNGPDVMRDLGVKAKEALAVAEQQEWQSIDSAPKECVWVDGIHRHGPWILAYPVFGRVARVRWWESDSASNFLEDGGNAVRPSHWMPLPSEPKEQP